MAIISFLWDEQKTRRLFKVSLIIYIFCGVIFSLYSTFLPTSTQFRSVIIIIPLIVILTAIINLVGLNWKYPSQRFLITNFIVQLVFSLFMVLAGGFISPVQYASYVLLFITLFQLGSDAAVIIGFWSVLTFIMIFLWQFHTAPRPTIILEFLVYTVPYLLFMIVSKSIGQELSHQSESGHKMEQVDDIKNQFIALSSHYLRSPLTTLKGFTSMLQKTYLNPEQQNQIHHINNSISDLELMIEKMLSISEIEKGEMKISTVDSNLDAVIKRVVEEKKPVLSDYGVSVTYHEMPIANFPFDPSKIKEALSYLLDNAIKFNKPTGTVDIYLSTEKNNAIIKINDTGAGMNQNQVKNLFSTFNKGGMDNVLHFNKPGIGLSMYLAKSIITAHRGTIEVSSVPSQGSSFTITLPMNNLETPENKT